MREFLCGSCLFGCGLLAYERGKDSADIGLRVVLVGQGRFLTRRIIRIDRRAGLGTKVCILCVGVVAGVRGAVLVVVLAGFVVLFVLGLLLIVVKVVFGFFVLVFVLIDVLGDNAIGGQLVVPGAYGDLFLFVILIRSGVGAGVLRLVLAGRGVELDDIFQSFGVLHVFPLGPLAADGRTDCSECVMHPAWKPVRKTQAAARMIATGCIAAPVMASVFFERKLISHVYVSPLRSLHALHPLRCSLQNP